MLDILRGQGAQATFFLIGEKLRPQISIVKRMVGEGHALGNHSWDHKYRNYFLGVRAMQSWIQRTHLEFRALDLPKPVGFRPPAGVVTPVVRRVLNELNEPLILWDHRFYDGVWPWAENNARRSAARLQGGEVVLLHDRQPERRSREFCRVLELYISLLRDRGFELASLMPVRSGPLPQRKQPASSYSCP